MNKMMDILKHYRYLMIPLAAILLIAGVFPAYCSQKNRPSQVGSEYLNLAIIIQQRIKSIDAKMADEYSFGVLPPSLHNYPSSLTNSSLSPKEQTVESIFDPAQVRGISFLQGKALVFIGDRVLKEGDWIGGFKIEKINKAGFTVTDHGGEQTRILLNPDND